MNWASFGDFIAMGGYGQYVWGAYLVSAGVLLQFLLYAVLGAFSGTGVPVMIVAFLIAITSATSASSEAPEPEPAPPP